MTDFKKYTAFGKDIDFTVRILSQEKYTFTVIVDEEVNIHGLIIPANSKVELCKVHFKVKEIE